MTDSPTVRVDRILQKLARARSLGLKCFGSDSHGFRLKPPIAEQIVVAFETQHDVLLPEDYRTFLLRAGNGGAGPYYGIYALDKSEDFADWVCDDRPADFLARPCPLREGMSRSENWTDQFGNESPYQGTLSLGTQGCTYGMQLVVTGTLRGRVIYVDAEGQPPYVVNEPDFLAWYERWLDELLGGYKMGWFGFGPGGGEESFFRIIEDSHASDEYKAQAASSFCRLPRLSDSADAKIVDCCTHPLAGVRAGACATIRHFGLRMHGEQIAKLLDDPSPAVRRAAVAAAMQLDPDRWAEAVLNLLRKETDREAAATAFFALKKTGVMTRSELLRILEGPNAGIRYLAAQTMDWTPADAALLLKLLQDPNAQVRHYAILGLRQVDRQTAVPHVAELLRTENDEYVVQSAIQMLGDFGGPDVVPLLLEGATDPDDFHRLAAVQALAKIGDERAVPVLMTMLQENRRPERLDEHGSVTNVRTIRELVQESLARSPNRALRELDGPRRREPEPTRQVPDRQPLLRRALSRVLGWITRS